MNPSEKYEFVSWDDDIPNIWKVIQNSCSSQHQPDPFWGTPMAMETQRPAAARRAGAARGNRRGAELSRSAEHAEHAEHGATGSSDLDIATATVLWLVKKM